MRNLLIATMVALLGISPVTVWAAEEGHGDGHSHSHGDEAAQENEQGSAAATEQTLTGEVVDVTCYLNEGEKGIGKKHASCARDCIEMGLPVAIRAGGQLYIASTSGHQPANALLAEFAGKTVTVHGKIMERDGLKFVSVSSVEKAK